MSFVLEEVVCASSKFWRLILSFESNSTTWRHGDLGIASFVVGM